MGSINPKDWQKMEGAGTIDFEEFVNLVVPTQASASTKAPATGVKGKPSEEEKRKGSDEAETAKAAKETEEECKEEEQEAADRRNIVVHEGHAAFAELLRQSDTMSTLLTSQEYAEDKLLLAAEEEPAQSPAQRAVQQVRDNRISTLDLRKLPASKLDAVLMDFCDAITVNTSLLRLHLDGIGLGNVNGGVQVVAPRSRYETTSCAGTQQR
jgi:hypothetical protein